ncbi:MAG: glycoside hydrolase family 13 protein [Clostridia bacterium]|nr:glycoside hydrolase family 13 protein [Clostridia bacterium]
MCLYNPLDKYYKSITGAISETDKLTIRVKGNFDSIVFICKNDLSGFEEYYLMEKEGDTFKISLSLKAGLYFYCFGLDNGKFISKNQAFLGEIMSDKNYFQLTVFSKDFFVPEWFSGGIMYQIFPDRFCRKNENVNLKKGDVLHENWLDTPVFLPNKKGKVLNNDFFGGDINGIISKLDYLVGLGVSVIYLNPIFEARSNHRYDTGDYMKIDSMLGSEDDFRNLILEADKRGIKIILDGVFNHTGDDSTYFNKYGRYKNVGAYQSKDSDYYNWFNFDNHPDLYQSWWGIDILPSTNKQKDSPYIDFITGTDGVLEHYTKMGIGGWRLDVVDELPSHFVKRIRSAVKGVNDNAIVIGEVWEDASNKISYGERREYFQGKELDSVMNYPLKNAIINFAKNGDVKGLVAVIKEQIDHYPSKVLHSLMNILSTHDTYRLITAVGGAIADGLSKVQMSNIQIPENKLSQAKFKQKVASLLQYTLIGVPCVYYGDEIAMQGYADPLNRRCYPWGEEDFEMLSWYQLLGSMRSSFNAIKFGDFEEIYATDGILIFKRVYREEEVLIAVNVSDAPIEIQFEGKLKDFISENTFDGGASLPSNSFMVLYCEE